MGNDKKSKYVTKNTSTSKEDPNLDKFLGELADWEEANKGGKGGGDNWGTNRSDITSRDKAIAFYKEKYLPMVANIPKGLQYKALQAAINTGRHKGFALKAAGYYDDKGDVTEKGKAAGITGTHADNSKKFDLKDPLSRSPNDDYYDKLSKEINSEYAKNPNGFKELYGIASDYHYANAKGGSGKTFNEEYGDFHNKEYDIASKYDKDLDTPASTNTTSSNKPTQVSSNKYITKNTPKLIGGVNTLVQKDGTYKQYPDGRKTYTKTGGKEQEVTSQVAMDAFDKLHPSFKPVGKRSMPGSNGLPSFDPGEEDINKFDPGEEEPLDNGVRYDRGTGPDPVTYTPQSGIPYSRQPDNNLASRYLKKDGLTFKGYDKPVGGGSTGIGESYTEKIPGGDLHIEKTPDRVVPTSSSTGTGLLEFDNKREFNPGRLTNIAYNMLTANSPVEFPKLGRFMPEAYQYADMSAAKRKAILENRNYVTKAMQGSVNRGVSQGNLAAISAQHVGAMEAVNEGEAQRAMQLKLANVDMGNKAKEFNIGQGDKESVFQSQAEGLKHQAGQAAAVETSALAQATDIEKGMQRQDYNKYNMDKWVMENGLVGTDNYYYDANGRPQFRSTGARRYSQRKVNIDVTPDDNTITQPK